MKHNPYESPLATSERTKNQPYVTSLGLYNASWYTFVMAIVALPLAFLTGFLSLSTPNPTDGEPPLAILAMVLGVSSWVLFGACCFLTLLLGLRRAHAGWWVVFSAVFFIGLTIVGLWIAEIIPVPKI